jgi:hypothetical protein
MFKIKSKKTKVGYLFALTFLFAISACDKTSPLIGSSKLPLKKGPPAKTSVAYAQFPDIPIPSGAAINIEKTLVFGSKPWFGQLSLSTSTSVAYVFDFYRSNLPQYKWQELASVRAKSSFLTYDSEDRVLSITIEGSTIRGAEVLVTVSPKGSTSFKSTEPTGDLMTAPVR